MIFASNEVEQIHLEFSTRTNLFLIEKHDLRNITTEIDWLRCVSPSVCLMFYIIEYKLLTCLFDTISNDCMWISWF